MNIKNINNILNHITSVKNGTDKKEDSLRQRRKEDL